MNLALCSCLALLLALAPGSARAGEGQDDAAHFYVAADPLPYLLHGFSAHAGVQLPGNAFSLEASLFSSQLPSSLLGVVAPGDDGFNVRLRGATLEGYWHFARWGRNALLAGLQLHLDRYQVDDQGGPQSSFNQVYLLPTVGFRWFPFAGAGLFVKPFVSAGPALLGTAPVNAGGHAFQQLSWFPLATVMIGYQF